jgi:hypothetical protein
MSKPELQTKNARLYFGRKLEEVPPHPGAKWTRFVCISDTHSRIYPIPDGDVLLHAGDITGSGRIGSLQKMVAWLKGLPHQKKV